MIQSTLARTRRVLAASKVGLHVVTKLRNQCELVIGEAHGWGNGCDPNANGETRWLCSVSDGLRYIVDVGANRGDWTSLVLSQKELEGALLFDPSSSAAEILRRHFSDHPEIEIIEAAAGSAPGTMSFFEEENAGRTSSLVAGFSTTRKSTEVRVTTIDAEVDLRGWPSVDFLKVDAEGYDFHVLEGAERLFAQRKIRYGQFEYNAPWRLAGTTLTRTIQWLKAFGYHCYALRPDGLRALDTERFREYFLYSNYAIIRDDLVEEALQRFARAPFCEVQSTQHTRHSR